MTDLTAFFRIRWPFLRWLAGSWKLREDRHTVGQRALGHTVYIDFPNSIIRIEVHGQDK